MRIQPILPASSRKKSCRYFNHRAPRSWTRKFGRRAGVWVGGRDVAESEKRIACHQGTSRFFQPSHPGSAILPLPYFSSATGSGASPLTLSSSKQMRREGQRREPPSSRASSMHSEHTEIRASGPTPATTPGHRVAWSGEL